MWLSSARRKEKHCIFCQRVLLKHVLKLELLIAIG